MAWTAGVGRDHFPHRAGVAFHDAYSLREGLRAVAHRDGEMSPRTAPVAATAPKLAFSYAGEGTRRAAMGEILYRTEPVVRAVLDRCDEVFRTERGGTSLLDVMFRGTRRKGGRERPGP